MPAATRPLSSRTLTLVYLSMEGVSNEICIDSPIIGIIFNPWFKIEQEI